MSENKKAIDKDNLDESWVTKLLEWADKNNIPELKLIEMGSLPQYNYYIGLPRDKKSLLNLTHLNLSSNNIIELPPEIGKLLNLEELDLDINQIETLPIEIGELKKLIKLKLSNNKIGELPKEIGNLTKLTILDLTWNYISELPEELENLYRSKILILDSNPLKKKGYTIGFENLNIKLDELEDRVIYEFKDYFINAKHILLKISCNVDTYEVKRVINYIENSISKECIFEIIPTQKTSGNILVSFKISSLNKHTAPSEFEIDSISKSFYTEIVKDDKNFTVKLSPKENQEINLAVITLTDIDNLSIKYDDIFIDNFTKIYSCSTQHLKNIILIYLSDLLIYHFYLPLAHKHKVAYNFTKDTTQYEKILILQNCLKGCNG